MPKRKAVVCLAIWEVFKRPRLMDHLLLAMNWVTTTECVLQNISLAGILVRNTHFRITSYYEDWIEKYLDYDFFALFRMTPSTFSTLVNEVRHLEAQNKKASQNVKSVNLEKGLLMTVWYLAKGETLISIADRFGVSISTTHENGYKNIKLLTKLIGKYIKWPNKVESTYVAEQFLQSCGYPNVIGAIDGSHINCKVPENQHDSYANRKLTHSVIIQAISTSTKLFTNVCIGFPGSVHDSRVLRESTLYKTLLERGKEQYFYEDYHLIGDSAYPCLDWLMTPYRDTGRLTRQQRKHNVTLSRGRVVIEHTFGLLKGRWRILKYIDVYSIEKVIFIISACCVLHNFCLLKNDNFEVDEDEQDDEPEEPTEKDSCSGLAKRDFICNNL